MVGGGGIHWPVTVALSLCLFDIWPKRQGRMKEQAGKKRRIKSGVCLPCLAEYSVSTNEVKPRQREEMKDRHAWSGLRRKTEVPE